MVNKKKIVLITLLTPTRENTRGASALPYHLAKNRPKEVDLKIFTFNSNGIAAGDFNEISKELNATIEVVQPGLRYKWLSAINRILPFMRGILPYPMAYYVGLNKEIVKEINEWSTEIWIYGEEFAHFAKLFPDRRCVITTPDCEAMYYQRVLSMPSKLNSFFKIIRYGRAYWQYLNLAKSFPCENSIYHLVGKEDTEFLKKINPNIKAVFIPHPHYEGNTNRQIKFSSPKIKLLLPGRYDFYCQEAVDEVIEALANSEFLSPYYEITFQGKNWDKPAEKLAEAGFSVHVKGFVPDYKEELCQHDIQLSPISLGTGTKGKVLDAFVNGLLVVAPLRAIENIEVKNKQDYLFYNNAKELVEILKAIPKDREYFESTVVSGRNKVLLKHDPQFIAEQFFAL